MPLIKVEPELAEFIDIMVDSDGKHHERVKQEAKKLRERELQRRVHQREVVKFRMLSFVVFVFVCVVLKLFVGSV